MTFCVTTLMLNMVWAAYVQTDIAQVNHLATTTLSDTLVVGGFHVANVYKPPSASWEQKILPTLLHLTIYVGDFNSHYQDWGYSAPTVMVKHLQSRHPDMI
ncbi:hypothetical protein AAFF_G00175950 [Aldrovandia affinis]|uniref:Endonuclease/exonuclease/phosphatase domain-containing protein n=1 Tax=Aldrovandia affinis TaxID=143900 RepID=A0AAD7W6L2_9TELE|nr:hypothetical protein AAFF_G00175950 [Aldrovandia affinis]